MFRGLTEEIKKEIADFMSKWPELGFIVYDKRLVDREKIEKYVMEWLKSSTGSGGATPG